jgi:DNA-damage-inducible protein J
MAATALVQAKIEPELKSVVEKYFADFGIDTSTAIRMFLKKVAHTRSIPFTIGIETWEDEPECSYEPTDEFAAILDKEIANIKAGRGLVKFKPGEDAISYLQKRKKK